MLLNILLLIQWQNKYPLLNEEEFMVGWGLWGGAQGGDVLYCHGKRNMGSVNAHKTTLADVSSD